MKYPGIVHKEDNCYWIEFPDLKGCLTQGDTMEELFFNAQEALSLYVEDMSIFPEPSIIEGDNIIFIDMYKACKEASKKELQKWIELRRQGWTFQRIADKYKVSKQYISEMLDKAGLPRKTKWSWAYFEWDKLYREGSSIDKISEKYNCNKATIYNYLKKKFSINKSEANKKGWVTKKRKQMINI
jgi:predicted RNase H-like HicB family nuclease/uncharacterized protein (DUF433 family)